MNPTTVTLTNMCMLCRGEDILVLDKTDPSYRGITFPGGHVETGESLQASIVREVFEETGLTIRQPEFCGIYHWIKPDGSRYLVFLYRCCRFEGDITPSREGNVFWLPQKDFLQQELAQGMDTVFRMMQEPHLQECFWDPAADRETLY